MRVMILSGASVFDGFPYGGAESSLAMIGRELAVQGHAVSFAAFSRIKRGGNVTPHARHIKEANYSIDLFRPMTGTSLATVRRINAARFASMVQRVCKRDQIAVIYCTYEPEVLQAALAARKACPGLRVVMRMAGLAWYETGKDNPKATAMFERLFSGIDAINFLDAPSKALSLERLNELGLGHTQDPSRDFIMDIGVDTAQIDAARETLPDPSADGVFSLVMVARFSDYQKRQDILVQAIALARKKVPLRLLLIGGQLGNWDHISKLVDTLGLQDCVTLSPFLPQAEVWQNLSRADLVCHACDYEGVSKAMLEAMALGRPMLASDVAPLNQMLKHQETGYLTPNTPEDWAEHLVALYNDPKGRAATGRAAHAWVQQTYAMPQRAAAYADAFEALANAPQIDKARANGA